MREKTACHLKSIEKTNTFLEYFTHNSLSLMQQQIMIKKGGKQQDEAGLMHFYSFPFKMIIKTFKNKCSL